MRDNAQRVRPAYLSLSAVLDTYTNTNLINELTGTNGIKKIDVFFDTLFIQTTGSVIFEKLNYDYDTDNIFSISDNARYISLAMPVSTSFIREFANTNFTNYTFAKAGETWFFPQEKIAIISVCGFKNNILTPELYSYDFNSLVLQKVFPIISRDLNTLQNLSSINLASINEPLLSHNTFKKEYLLVVSGKDNNSEDILIEINIKDLPQLEISTISVYTTLSSSTISESPAIIHDLSVTLNTLDTLNFQCTATSTPVIYTPVSLPSWVTLTETGLFEGTSPLLPSTYLATFTVNNAIGPTYYSLNITVQ